MFSTSELDQIKVLSTSDTKSLGDTLIKTMEEVGELSQAHLIAEQTNGCTYRSQKENKRLEEAVDVIFCAMSYIHRLDLSEQEIQAMISTKLSKWASVTSV